MFLCSNAFIYINICILSVHGWIVVHCALLCYIKQSELSLMNLVTLKLETLSTCAQVQ